jgi:hypothetical protein
MKKNTKPPFSHEGSTIKYKKKTQISISLDFSMWALALSGG